MRLAANAKSNTRMRNKRGRNHLHDIDGAHLLHLLQKQKVKCAYSGHHLTFQTGKVDCISLERINVHLGYVKGNCCLVMQCLNTIDWSSHESLANTPKSGSGGWSREKVQYLRDHRNNQ